MVLLWFSHGFSDFHGFKRIFHLNLSISLWLKLDGQLVAWLGIPLNEKALMVVKKQ